MTRQEKYMRSITKTLRYGFAVFTMAIVFGCAMTGPGVSSAIQLPVDRPITIRNSPVLSLSPDGRYLAYPADTESGDVRQLYLGAITGNNGRLLEGTRDAEMPFFSPDGKWIGFFADGKLAKISIENGQLVILADAPEPAGASWRDDDMILFGSAGSIWQVHASGGTAKQITRTGDGETHRWPAALPDTRQVLFNLWAQGKTTPSVVIQQIDTGERWTLVDQGNSPRYSPTGHVLYTDVATLKAVPIDLRARAVTDVPVKILDNVLVSPATGVAHYGVASDGSLLSIAGGVFGSARRVVIIDRDGNERDAGLPPGRYGYVRFSPDGRQLALETGEVVPEIWLYDREHKRLSLLVEGASFPVWTPDGEWITFSSSNAGVPGIFRVSVKNPSNVQQLAIGQYPRDHSYAWSADGSILAYTEIHPDSGMDIHLLALQNGQLSQPWAQSESQECCPVFSPDGRLLAFISGAPGHPEIYLGSVTEGGQRWKVSTNGGREPVWSPDGKELFYWQDRQLMAVAITPGPVPVIARPVPLIEGVFVSSTSTWRTRYDVTPDGREFIIIRRGPEETGITELRMLSDGFARLKN